LIKLSEKELNELVSIKKLLVFQLLKEGTPGTSIAKLLGMDQGNFSRMFPVKKLLKEPRKA
jgi:hypothetical protein